MKKLCAAIFGVFSLSTFAFDQSVSFSYFGREGWGEVFYSCDYVEAQTEKVLTLFGATNAEVRCSGGIQPWGGFPMPISVTATFDAPILSGRNESRVVTFRGDTWNPACGLNVTIVRNLVPVFSNVKIVKKSDSCAFQQSNFSYEFAITE